MRLTWLIIGMALSGVMTAQPKLSISNTEALIGDRLDLTLSIGNLRGEWINSDVIPADSAGVIQVLGDAIISGSVADGSMKKQWPIAVYDTGIVRIPALPVVARNGSRLDTFYTNDIPVRIEGVVDSAGMIPIKPIVYEPVRLSDYVPYILGLFAVIGVALALWWWSKRPKREEKVIEIVDIKPPHEIALMALEELESRKLWEQGLIAEYHSELSHITRAYLEERYQVSALESTTSELRQILTGVLSDEQYGQMIQMMQLEDLIKFAKATPPVELHQQHLDFVREFVINTKQELETDA